MGPGDVCRVPLAAVRHGRARQTSESGPCGDCRRVLWLPGPRGQYSGNIRFIEKHGVQDEGGRHVAKQSSDPRKAYPEVKLQGRDLVRVVGIVAPFAPMEGRYAGKIRFIEPRGGNGPRSRVAGVATGEPGKLQSRDRVGIVEGFCGYRARVVSIRGKIVLSRKVGYKTRGSPCC